MLLRLGEGGFWDWEREGSEVEGGGERGGKLVINRTAVDNLKQNMLEIDKRDEPFVHFTCSIVD